MTPQSYGGMMACAAGQSLSYQNRKVILSWELGDGAAGQQTIVDLLKGTGERIQGGLLAERFVSHSLSSRLRCKDRRLHHQNAHLCTDSQRRTSREHYLNEEDCTPAAATLNHRDGQAAATGGKRKRQVCLHLYM